MLWYRARTMKTEVCLDLVTFMIVFAQVLISPFTKVEESFFVQATHDLLQHGTDIDQYDHLQFPGVVPRTFIGPVVLAGLASPWQLLFNTLGLHKLLMLVVVRSLLGGLTTASLSVFRRSLAWRFRNDQLSIAFALVSCCQFHLLFYASRPLANVFALCLVLIGCSYWLRGRYGGAVFLLAFATACFRCDVILLAIPLLLAALVDPAPKADTGTGTEGEGEGEGESRVLPSFWQRFHTLLLWGIVGSIFSVSLTILVDSVFWQRWLWPEGEVLWFNTALNKSSDYGVSPFHWYFLNALPRSLLVAIPLLPFGLLQHPPTLTALRLFVTSKEPSQRCNPMLLLAPSRGQFSLLWPAVVFVFLYSFLPHKELRFIFPALPFFNAVAAMGLCKLHMYRKKDILTRVCWLGAVCGLVISVVCTGVFTVASFHNYPGGYALHRFHSLQLPHHPSVLSPPSPPSASAGSSVWPSLLSGVPPAHMEHVLASDADTTVAHRPTPTLHIDNLAATTGASRFGEFTALFQYSKQEGLSPADKQGMQELRYLVSEQPTVPGFVPLGTYNSADGKDSGSGNGDGDDSGNGNGNGAGGQRDERTVIYAIDRVRFSKRTLVTIQTRPVLYLLERERQAHREEGEEA